MWCAVSRYMIAEPIFFENTNNSKRYNETVLDFPGHFLTQKTAEAWFQ
jgi:hypothetical protein